MIRYVAWLRGINVGGHNMIPMKDLCLMFEAAGLRGVTSFIQSGNVLFESSSANPQILVSRIRRELRKTLGYEVDVMLRTMADVRAMVDSEPFQRIRADTHVKFFVSFLSAAPSVTPALPLLSAEGDVEVLQVRDREVFTVSRLMHGRYGFANPFLEKQFGVAATTRGWPTVLKVVALSDRLPQSARRRG